MIRVQQDPVAVELLPAYLEELVARTPSDVRVELVTVMGDVVASLVAESAGASLVVLGADELPWIARATGSEISQRVAMEAAAPVVIVPRTDLGARHTSAVVVAVDDDGDVDAQLAFAFEQALVREEPLEIVYAAGTMSDYPGRLAHLDGLESRVDRWRVRFPGVQAKTLVEGGHPVRACLDAALRASLLVVGQPARAHSRLASRSFASRVLREASSPVAVVPLDWGSPLARSARPVTSVA
jgi:nucleotide-binding universal stress UspA family protein